MKKNGKNIYRIFRVLVEKDNRRYETNLDFKDFIDIERAKFFSKLKIIRTIKDELLIEIIAPVDTRVIDNN